MERLGTSKLTKRRKEELADCYNLNKSDPEYEVFKRGNTFYISKRDNVVVEPAIKETIEDVVKQPVKSKKTKTNNIGKEEQIIEGSKNESFSTLLDHVIQLHQHVARIDRKYKKHKGKFNRLQDDLFSSAEALNEAQEIEQDNPKSIEQTDSKSEEEEVRFDPPKFTLRRRC